MLVILKINLLAAFSLVEQFFTSFIFHFIRQIFNSPPGSVVMTIDFMAMNGQQVFPHTPMLALPRYLSTWE